MLTAEERSAILQLDTCKIANAIEKLNIRLRNEGFTQSGLLCVTGGYPSVLGYAVTSKVKCADPPMKGYSYYDLSDWWQTLQASDLPKIAVIQDVDPHPGQGAVLSNVHAEILKALGCLSVVTNGAVRDVPALAAMEFPVFSRYVAISHAYVHMIDHGTPVDLLGLRVAEGDLIYADVHGVINIPGRRLEEILQVAQRQADQERTIIDLCRSNPLSFSALREAVKSL
jgi:4-hydroxy-4-methyl-2-oxoglutarate aldolase